MLAYTLYSTMSRSVQGLHGDEWQKFWVFSFYSWLVPGVISGLTLLLTLQFKLLPYLHSGACWLDGTKTLPIFFGLPLGCMISINIILFIMTVLKIHKILKSTSIASTAVQKDDYQYLKLYVKLFSLMGFMWIFGFLGNVKAIYWTRYIFTVCNTLQGVFIFLCIWA